MNLNEIHITCGLVDVKALAYAIGFHGLTLDGRTARRFKIIGCSTCATSEVEQAHAATKHASCFALAREINGTDTQLAIVILVEAAIHGQLLTSVFVATVIYIVVITGGVQWLLGEDIVVQVYLAGCQRHNSIL